MLPPMLPPRSVRLRLIWWSYRYRLGRLVWLATGWPYRGTEDNFPFCSECGERNVLDLDDGPLWLDEWHRPGCHRPHHRALRRRYIRRYGERAARRHGGLSW